jgi:hypothetical protein
VANSADDGYLIALKFHPGTATDSESSTGKVIPDICAVNFNARGEAFNYGNECRTMRLPCRQPSHHDRILS